MTTWTDYSDADDATFRAVGDRIEATPEAAEAWRGGNRAECPLPWCTPPPGGFCGPCPAFRRIYDAAEQRGAERVAQRMRELAEELERNGGWDLDYARAVRAALADVAPPTAGREGR